VSATNLLDFLDADGHAAPPRSNGELVFQAPWESRVFGVTISLYRAGLFEWDEFRLLLIEEIAAWEKQGYDRAEWSYYERWQSALERLLAAKKLCATDELVARSRALANRPTGHDQ
jgi:nitrile hydratase accessory protein